MSGTAGTRGARRPGGPRSPGRGSRVRASCRDTGVARPVLRAPRRRRPSAAPRSAPPHSHRPCRHAARSTERSRRQPIPLPRTPRALVRSTGRARAPGLASDRRHRLHRRQPPRTATRRRRSPPSSPCSPFAGRLRRWPFAAWRPTSATRRARSPRRRRAIPISADAASGAPGSRAAAADSDWAGRSPSRRPRPRVHRPASAHS